jgi:hypothetical protein
MKNKRIKGNPTLLSLLKAGCNIELPSGYALRGDPDQGYIYETKAGGGHDGLRRLTAEGLKDALSDAHEDEIVRNQISDKEWIT